MEIEIARELVAVYEGLHAAADHVMSLSDYDRNKREVLDQLHKDIYELIGKVRMLSLTWNKEG